MTVHKLEGEQRYHVAMEEGGKLADVYATFGKRPAKREWQNQRRRGPAYGMKELRSGERAAEQDDAAWLLMPDQ